MIFPAHLIKGLVIQKIDVNKGLVLEFFPVAGRHRLLGKYAFLLGTSARHIVNITFLDSAVVPSNAIEFWDISETKDKGVMAYVVENDDSNNAASMYALFCDDINSETLDLSSFNTSNVASMGAMFMSGTER